MDYNNDVMSPRYLLRNLLHTELPKTPVTRSMSQALHQSSAIRSSAALSRSRRGTFSPQKSLRRKLKQKLYESASRSPLQPSKRAASSLSQRVQTPQVMSSVPMDVDGVTPRGLLRGILQTEPEMSLLVPDRPVRNDNEPGSAESSYYSSRQSTGTSNLDLPDLSTVNLTAVVRGISRKRPARNVNLSVFERKVDQGAVVREEQQPDSTENLSNLSGASTSLSSLCNLSMKTPYVGLGLEPCLLKRRVSKRKAISVEDFEDAVQNHLVRNRNPDMEQSFRPAQVTLSETGVQGTSSLSIPDASDIIMCNTALYAQPITTTRDNVTAMQVEENQETRESVGTVNAEVKFTEEEMNVDNGEVVGMSLRVTEEVDFMEGPVTMAADEMAAVGNLEIENIEKSIFGVEEEEAVESNEEDEEEAVPTNEEEDAAVESVEEEKAVESVEEEEEAVESVEEEEEAVESVEEEEDAAVESVEEEEDAAVESVEEEEDAAVESVEEEDAAVESVEEEEEAVESVEEEEIGERGIAGISVRVEEDNTDEDVEEELVELDVEKAVTSQHWPSREYVARRAFRSEGGVMLPGVAALQRDYYSFTDGLQPADTGSGSGSARVEPGQTSKASEGGVTKDWLSGPEEGSSSQVVGLSSSERPPFPGVRERSGRKSVWNPEGSPPLTNSTTPGGEEEVAESQEEDGYQSEEMTMKTPAFIREKKRTQTPAPLATPNFLKTIMDARKPSKAPAKPPPKRRPRNPAAHHNPGLPKSYVMSVFRHFAKTKVSADVYPVLQDIMDKYFDRLAEDLEVYAAHAKRKTIEVEDVELLLRRQGYVTESVPVNVLIERHLPLEYRKLLIPVATSGNKVIPKQKR